MFSGIKLLVLTVTNKELGISKIKSSVTRNNLESMMKLVIQSILELILTSVPVEQDIIRCIRAKFVWTTKNHLLDACCSWNVFALLV
jgi:hypothetical protein